MAGRAPPRCWSWRAVVATSRRCRRSHSSGTAPRSSRGDRRGPRGGACNRGKAPREKGPPAEPRRCRDGPWWSRRRGWRRVAGPSGDRPPGCGNRPGLEGAEHEDGQERERHGDAQPESDALEPQGRKTAAWPAGRSGPTSELTIRPGADAGAPRRRRPSERAKRTTISLAAASRSDGLHRPEWIAWRHRRRGRRGRSRPGRAWPEARGAPG